MKEMECLVRCAKWCFIQVNVRLQQTVTCHRRLIAGLLPRRTGLDASSFRVRFVVAKLAMGQSFSEYFRFLLTVSFRQCFPLIFIYTLPLPERQMGEAKETSKSNPLPKILRALDREALSLSRQRVNNSDAICRYKGLEWSRAQQWFAAALLTSKNIFLRTHWDSWPSFSLVLLTFVFSFLYTDISCLLFNRERAIAFGLRVLLPTHHTNTQKIFHRAIVSSCPLWVQDFTANFALNYLPYFEKQSLE